MKDRERLAKVRRMRAWAKKRKTKREKALAKALLFIEKVRENA